MIRPDSTSPTSRILVVDDEAFVREAIELYLLTEGFEVVSVGGGHDALRMIEEQSFDLAILDIMMPGMSGVELLGEIKARQPDLEVVMASGCGSLETAVEAMRMGAYDYVPKPILNFQDDLLRVITKALERRQLLGLNRKLAADVQVVNRELKDANSQLKRQLAIFDLLYDSGRMLADIGNRSEVLRLAHQVLEYQFGVESALVLIKCGNQLRPELVHGIAEPLDSGHIPTWEELESFEGHAETPSLEVERWLSTLHSNDAEPPDRASSPWQIASLRSAGVFRGVVLIRQPNNSVDSKLLELFAHQLAAPLALSSEEVTG